MNAPNRRPSAGPAITTSATLTGAASGADVSPADGSDFPGRYRLLTKKDVAAVYSISVRCLENWINEGRVPAPVRIGSKPYWHPERFYAELSAQTLGAGQAKLLAAEAPAGLSQSRNGRRGVQPPELPPCATRLTARTQTNCDDIKRRLRPA